MKKHEPLFVCDSCDNECNCHPAEELRLNGDKLICGNCADDLTEEEFNSLVKFVPELETELADARAEIEWLKKELRDNNYQAVRQIIPAEMAAEDGQLEVQRLNAECNKLDAECNKWVKRLREKEDGFAITLRHMSIQAEQKDRLVEQLTKALKAAFKYPNTEKLTGTNLKCLDNDLELIRAALSAAERGE